MVYSEGDAVVEVGTVAEESAGETVGAEAWLLRDGVDVAGASVDAPGVERSGADEVVGRES